MSTKQYQYNDEHTILIRPHETKDGRYQYALIGVHESGGYASDYIGDFATEADAKAAAIQTMTGAPPPLGVHVRDGVGSSDKVGG